MRARAYTVDFATAITALVATGTLGNVLCNQSVTRRFHTSVCCVSEKKKKKKKIVNSYTRITFDFVAYGVRLRSVTRIFFTIFFCFFWGAMQTQSCFCVEVLQNAKVSCSKRNLGIIESILNNSMFL
jgi:hypothetical protein